MTTREKTKKIFIASLDELYDMLGFVRSFAQEVGFEKDVQSRIELACEEALVNIISYGYPEAGGIIDITLHFNHQQELVITIKDNGVPFNPLAIVEKFSVKEVETNHSIGGYGTYIMVKMMDDVAYKRGENANILTLIKKK